MLFSDVLNGPIGEDMGGHKNDKPCLPLPLIHLSEESSNERQVPKKRDAPRVFIDLVRNKTGNHDCLAISCLDHGIHFSNSNDRR